MIKINLLPHAKRAKTSDAEKQVMLFVLLILVVSVAVVSLGIWSGGKVRELEKVVQEKEARKQMLMSRVGRVNSLLRELEAVEANIRAIREIRLKQQLPVRYVDESVRILPGERMWFENMNLSRDGVLDIRGVALDNQAFAMYVDDLRKSAYVRNVMTQRTSSRRVMDLDLVEFQFQVRAGPDTSNRDSKSHED
jgi:type IV pilus assembly protein PilN